MIQKRRCFVARSDMLGDFKGMTPRFPIVLVLRNSSPFSGRSIMVRCIGKFNGKIFALVNLFYGRENRSTNPKQVLVQVEVLIQFSASAFSLSPAKNTPHGTLPPFAWLRH